MVRSLRRRRYFGVKYAILLSTNFGRRRQMPTLSMRHRYITSFRFGFSSRSHVICEKRYDMPLPPRCDDDC